MSLAAIITLFLPLTIIALSCWMTYASENNECITADQALQLLMDGNRRYVDNAMTICKAGEPSARNSLVTGQRPFAIILSCSDSRVPPEIVFDRSLGEIFVVRVAGNVADPMVLGSIEYAAEHLGVPLIKVLGHQGCGAVIAAVDSHGQPHGNIGAIIGAIAPAVEQARKETVENDKEMLVRAVVDNNIRLVCQSLVDRSSVIRKLVREEKLKIIGARYDLDSGEVKLLSETTSLLLREVLGEIAESHAQRNVPLSPKNET